MSDTRLRDIITDEQIFAYMPNLTFIPSETIAEYLDIEYFNNRSGNKQASPLVEKLSNQTDYLTTLGAIVSNRFRAKWEAMFRQYASLETLNLLRNIDIERSTAYGHKIDRDAENTLAKTGSETYTLKGSVTQTESSSSNNPYKERRTITGGYTDADTTAVTRTGAQETTESFPEPRKSAKVTTGGYSDTDTVTTTRTGVEKVTEKGDTTSSVYGFNSSNPVPSTKVGPTDSSLGTTSETTYGDTGLKDTHSGAITRAYGDTGLKEETTESGQRKTATSFGQTGLKDEHSGNVQRTYNNYVDETSVSGSKTHTTDYGVNGKTNELSFDSRSDNTTIDETVAHSGEDVQTESGYRYNSLIAEYVAMFESADMFDFLNVVYSDVDKVLTCPYYV